MPRYIVKHGEQYLVWSTIVDAPLTFGCSLEELRTFWRDEYGMPSLMRLDQSLATGGDAYQAIWQLKDVVAGNRAGADESELTLEQIIDFYFIRRSPRVLPPVGKYPLRAGRRIE